MSLTGTPTNIDTTANGSGRSRDDIHTVSFVSLGCPKNLVDSEKMLGLLAEDGLTPVSWNPDSAGERWDDAKHVEGRALSGNDADDDDVQPADAVVINTCGFLEASKAESMDVIAKAVAAKARGDVKRVVVAGCLVQRHRAKMLEWQPGIDALIGVFDRDHIVDAVRGVKGEREALQSEQTPNYWVSANALVKAKSTGLNTVGLTVQGKDGKGLGYFESDSARLRLTPRHYAYLRISEGCNQACAFCTIPSIRGKMRSKPVDRIADEARELLRDGAFELNLIGQDTTSYGDDIGLGWDQRSGASPAGLFGRGGLPDLLKGICDAADQEGAPAWVRMMYAYPSNFRDEFIDAFAHLCEKSHLLPYIDIPLQHGSNRMLEMMRRHVTAEHQTELMHTLRDRIPGLAIRTTFISGFPGETEADHEQLLAFIDEVGFDAVGVFEYSREPGTPAGTMEADPALAVPAEVKARRKNEIMELQQRIAFEQAEYVAEQFDPSDPEATGCRFDVLVDEALGEVDSSDDDADGGDRSTPPGPTLRLSRGRTYFQAPQIDAVTYVESARPLSPGELVPCVVVASEGYDLIARPVADLERRVGLPVIG